MARILALAMRRWVVVCRRWDVRIATFAAIAMMCLCVVPVVVAQEASPDQPLRLRIAWGGKKAQAWSGRIALDNGTFAEPQLLGMDADAAAAVWVDGKDIHVESPSPHLFDGVDVDATTLKNARLSISMTTAGAIAAGAASVRADVVLADALHTPFRLPLDDQGNELLVQRAPGDTLRIVTNRETLIFAPGELFTFDVQPVLDEIEPSTAIDIDTTLTPARGGPAISNQHQRLPVPVDGRAVATLHVHLPRQEGVYQFRLSVTRPPGFRQKFFPVGGAKPLVERLFQVVVLDSAPAPPANTATWRTVLEIDPANPRWFDRLPDWTQIRRIPGLQRRPLGSAHALVVNHALGNFVELPSTPVDSEPHWQAYPLPLEAIGLPHLLEIEYPNDAEQHLGISIVEPNAAGQVVSIGRDSGVYVEGLGHAEKIEKHKQRVVFWPRTNSPLLLVTNQHPTTAARFGQVRVLMRTSTSIAEDPWNQAQPDGRLVSAYLSRPLVPETFGASEGLDVATGHSVDDWQTFYESATRLADYLSYAGYNAATVSVLADGSGVYPSRKLLSTPLHNTSRMVAGARDVPCPDALELQLRVFDRCGLALVPAIQFAAPLPEIEALRRTSDPKSSGLEPVGPAGLTWFEANEGSHGQGPYYNLLDDRVQQAMLGVVGEIVDRYGQHPAFAGLAVQLSTNGYAVLPEADWCLDDATIARFERETGLALPNAGPERFAARQALLMSKYADQWRSWRTVRVSRFYQQLAERLRAGRPERHLLLTTEELFATPAVAMRFRPNIAGHASESRIEQSMLDLGIDAAGLANVPGVVICPTRYVESMAPLVDRATDIELTSAFASLRTHNASANPAAVLLYHRPAHERLASFDAKSPFGGHARLAIQSSADESLARQPYAAALRDGDPAIILDGGELLPLGQETATQQVRHILQQMPIDAPPTVHRESVVAVRTSETVGGTTCVVVNECPWSAEAQVEISVPAETAATRLVADGGANSATSSQTFAAGPQTWTVTLAPYETQAVRFAPGGVRVTKIHTTVSDAGQRELTAQIVSLRDRDLTASSPYPKLDNPGFEAIGGKSSVPGWQLPPPSAKLTADLDASEPHDGKTCLYLSNHDANATAVVESNTFATPPTGQLAMTVFIRGDNVADGAELRMVFETAEGETTYRRFAVLGGKRPGAPRLDPQWRAYAFPCEDLPMDSQARMRVKFELVGTGEIWIDDAKLYDLLFPLTSYQHSRQQTLELVKEKTAAERALEQGNLAECVQLLEGYWPRFLSEYTPVAPAVASRPAPAVPPAEPSEKPESETPAVGNRFKSWFPWK